MKRSPSLVFDEGQRSKRIRRSKTDREIEAELYHYITTTGEEIMPTNRKKYIGSISEIKSSIIPTWKVMFTTRQYPCRNFRTEEEAFNHIRVVNNKAGWQVKNIVYKLDDQYYCVLTQKQIMMFSYEHIGIVQKYTWHAHYNRNTNSFYADTTIIENKKKKTVYFHMMILPSINDSLTADHINRISLDNNASNLRLATHTIQSINKNISSTNKTGITGVQFNSKRNYYVALWTNSDGKRMSATFYVSIHGKETAKQLAIQVRKEKECTLPHYRLALTNK